MEVLMAYKKKKKKGNSKCGCKHGGK